MISVICAIRSNNFDSASSHKSEFIADLKNSSLSVQNWRLRLTDPPLLIRQVVQTINIKLCDSFIVDLREQ